MLFNKQRALKNVPTNETEVVEKENSNLVSVNSNKDKISNDGIDKSNTNDFNSSINVLGKYFTLQALKAIPLGSNFNMRPYDVSQLLEGADITVLKIMINSAEIKRYLPNMDLTTEDKVNDFLINTIRKTELGLEFTYAIRMNAFLAGMIFVKTPEMNKRAIGFQYWTIDFFLFELFVGRGLMNAALGRLLYFLKTSIGVEALYALIDADNKKSLNLIAKLPFDEFDNTGFYTREYLGVAPRVFVCHLDQVNFQ